MKDKVNLVEEIRIGYDIISCPRCVDVLDIGKNLWSITSIVRSIIRAESPTPRYPLPKQVPYTRRF